MAKVLVVELALPHVQSWGSRREKIRVTELATYCNYLSKKLLSGEEGGKKVVQEARFKAYDELYNKWRQKTDEKKYYF